MPISKSDFHHLKPPNWGKHISTCQFTQPGRNGHARTVSRFTVISNVPNDADDTGTIRSYDPYNASRVLQPCGTQASHAKIVIHRDCPDPGVDPSPTSISHSYRSYRSVGSSFRQRPRTGSRRSGTAGKLRSPQSSASSIRSQHSNPRVRASIRSKRAVDFSRVRNKNQRHGRNRNASLAAPASIAGDNTTYDRDILSPSSPRKEPKSNRVTATKSMTDVGKPRDNNTFIWSEELEQLGHRIAKDCDEAFRPSLLLSAPCGTGPESREASPFTLSLGTLPGMQPSKRTASVNENETAARPWDNRPLPPLPSQDTISPSSIRDCRRDIRPSFHKTVPYEHQSGLDAPGPERRVVSEPVYDRGGKTSRQLPAIRENTPDEWMRLEHGMPSTGLEMPLRVKNKGLDFLARAENTIRVVNSPAAIGMEDPVRAPEPLNVRKTSQNPGTAKPALAPSYRDPQRVTSHGSHPKSQSPDVNGNGASIPAKKRVASWFKWSSKEDASESSFVTVTDTSVRSRETMAGSEGKHPNRSVLPSVEANPAPRAQKKRPFGFSFWKGGRDDMKMSIEGKQA